jgi:hypothetical protein
MALAGSSLAMVHMTLSMLIFKLSLDNERPASSDLPSGREKCLLRQYMTNREAGSFSLYKNKSLDYNMGLLGLKIGWDLAWAFLVSFLLTVFPPNFFKSSGDCNHDVNGLFQL